MIGVIVGDIVGSRFEWNNIKSKVFDFFSPDCVFTDNTVMSLAICDALLENLDNPHELSKRSIMYLQEYGRRYPNAGYGGKFRDWLYSDDPQPYSSKGNGAAMRVSACGFLADSLKQTKEHARIVSEVTHSHPEGIKGAEAVACAVFLARSGKSIEYIKEFIIK